MFNQILLPMKRTYLSTKLVTNHYAYETKTLRVNTRHNYHKQKTTNKKKFD